MKSSPLPSATSLPLTVSRLRASVPTSPPGAVGTAKENTLRHRAESYQEPPSMVSVSKLVQGLPMPGMRDAPSGADARRSRKINRPRWIPGLANRRQASAQTLPSRTCAITIGGASSDTKLVRVLRNDWATIWRVPLTSICIDDPVYVASHILHRVRKG
jgi:hypothetical protein